MKPFLPLFVSILGSCAAAAPGTVPRPDTATTSASSSSGPPASAPDRCNVLASRSCQGALCGDPQAGFRRPAIRRLRGAVSYYADMFHGRRTASGERYDRAGLSAASRTLPFGAVLRIRRSDQPERAVIVRVNDRGPFGRNQRILDLSRAAAECIDMVRRGVVDVEAEVIDWGPRGAPRP